MSEIDNLRSPEYDESDFPQPDDTPRRGGMTLEAALREYAAGQLELPKPDEVQFPIPDPGYMSPERAEVYCPDCSGMGLVTYDVPVGHDLFGKAFPCPNPKCPALRRDRLRRQQRAAEVSNLPPGYEQLSFASFERLSQKDQKGKLRAYNWLITFADSAGSDYPFWVSAAEVENMIPGQKWTHPVDSVNNSAVLQGPPGVGKTGLIAATIRELVAYGVTPLYTRTQDLVDQLAGTYDNNRKSDEQSEAELLHVYKDAEVLILDEFNIQNVTAFRKQRIEDIIRHRVAHQLPILITCNASRDELTRDWGVRTTSVLFASSYWIAVGGQNLRPLPGNANYADNPV